MNGPSSLQRRIVFAYLLLALGSCVFFALIAAVAVEGIEQHLVDNRLISVASWAVPRYAAGLPVEMPAGLIYHHGDSIPLSLRKLPEGVQEKFVDGVGLHVLAGRDAHGEYVVVDHASDYEKIELVVYSMIGVGVLGFLGFSLFLGKFLARRFVRPISLLSASVMKNDLQAELPLLSNNDELGVLSRAFAARTAELNRFLARERFFTGDVSHELRTPLTIIIGAAEILVAQTRDQSELQGPASRILRAAMDAADCVTVLLLLARAPETIDAPETRLSSVLSAEIDRCQPLLRGKAVTLQLVVDFDFSVFARRELLAAAAGNLIRNACQYTEEGSVVVRLGRQAVTIEDTGPGIPAPIRARLSEGSTYSVPNGLASSAGSGLGLALVKRICEHLGAILTVRERAAGGSLFSIEFPQGLTKS
ncbi:MAG TPA: HAMP domain-containing sensor histidine kinase [Burkholderiales bacterium]|nr:HAMP domain-containing sensor histidine kinase [Burkholderiales bacterium]